MLLLQCQFASTSRLEYQERACSLQHTVQCDLLDFELGRTHSTVDSINPMNKNRGKKLRQQLELTWRQYMKSSKYATLGVSNANIPLLPMAPSATFPPRLVPAESSACKLPVDRFLAPQSPSSLLCRSLFVNQRADRKNNPTETARAVVSADNPDLREDIVCLQQ